MSTRVTVRAIKELAIDSINIVKQFKCHLNNLHVESSKKITGSKEFLMDKAKCLNKPMLDYFTMFDKSLNNAHNTAKIAKHTCTVFKKILKCAINDCNTINIQNNDENNVAVSKELDVIHKTIINVIKEVNLLRAEVITVFDHCKLLSQNNICVMHTTDTVDNYVSHRHSYKCFTHCPNTDLTK